jgi:hypothetical protein
MISILEADTYINNYVIDIEDWVDADESKKQRILNVSERVLKEVYPDFIIPNEAVYEYTAVLAIAFNDTNRLMQHGIASFGLTGVASFTFKQGVEKDLYDMIPRTTKELIGKANNVKMTGKSIKWTVM